MGYLSLGLAGYVLWAMSRRHFSPSQPRICTQLSIVLFTTLGLAAFYHGPQITLVVLGNEPSRTFLSSRFQTGLSILALVTVMEAVVVTTASSLFWQMLGPTLILFFASPLYLAFAGAGIINFVWSTILGGAQSALILLSSLFAGLGAAVGAIAVIKDEKDRRALLDLVRQEMNGLLKMAFTAFLGLGASLGVSMTILFREGEKAWSDQRLLGLSFTMVGGFVLVALGTLRWVVKPYLEHFDAVRYYYGDPAPSHSLETTTAPIFPAPGGANSAPQTGPSLAGHPPSPNNSPGGGTLTS